MVTSSLTSAVFVDFSCPHCQSTFRIPQEFSGRKGTCKRCHHKIAIPIAVAVVEEPPLPIIVVDRHRAFRKHQSSIRSIFVAVGIGLGVVCCCAVLAFAIMAKPYLAPEFDASNFEHTKIWAKAQTGQLNKVCAPFRARGNELGMKEAVKKVEAAITKQLLEIPGMEISWDIPIQRISTDAVILQVLWPNNDFVRPIFATSEENRPYFLISYVNENLNPLERPMVEMALNEMAGTGAYNSLHIGKGISLEKAKQLSVGQFLPIRGRIRRAILLNGCMIYLELDRLKVD